LCHVEANLEQQRGNLWLTTDIKKERFLHQNKIGTYNPRGDRVPPELITAIVTEKGITRPQDILKHITFDIMIHRSVVPKFKAYNVEDFIEKLKNPFVDDVHSMTEIYKIKSKYILYRKLIKMGIAGKSNLLRSDINLKIDYFLDIMSNKLYIVNIADSIHRSISSEKYFVKMLKLFKGIDEFERFDYLI
jgi:hypothetical protein